MKSTCVAKKLPTRGVNDEIKMFKNAWPKCLLNSYILLLIHLLYFRILEVSQIKIFYSKYKRNYKTNAGCSRRKQGLYPL